MSEEMNEFWQTRKNRSQEIKQAELARSKDLNGSITEDPSIQKLTADIMRYESGTFGWA